MTPDLRVCFLGDSFVAGVGDPEHLGWVRRLVARTHREGQPLTAYDLGVRRDTSRDVLRRWRGECEPRLPAGSACRVVLSFGVNDTAEEGGAVRVPPAESATCLARVLEGAAAAAWPALVVGPPPVAGEAQVDRLRDLDRAFAAVCAQSSTPYASVLEHLVATPAWMREVAEGDGAHPGRSGYEELAALVWPTWLSWIGLQDSEGPRVPGALPGSR